VTVLLLLLLLLLFLLMLLLLLLLMLLLALGEVPAATCDAALAVGFFFDGADLLSLDEAAKERPNEGAGPAPIELLDDEKVDEILRGFFVHASA